MKLHNWLKLMNITPGAFARRAAVPRSTISRLLNGERLPGLELMEQIQKATCGAVMPNDFSRVQSNHSEVER
jgi:transcriptional regulator with XRE-family HTH domain